MSSRQSRRPYQGYEYQDSIYVPPVDQYSPQTYEPEFDRVPQQPMTANERARLYDEQRKAMRSRQPQPRRPPSRTDPVARAAMYEKEWQRFGTPGEKKLRLRYDPPAEVPGHVTNEAQARRYLGLDRRPNSRPARPHDTLR